MASGPKGRRGRKHEATRFHKLDLRKESCDRIIPTCEKMTEGIPFYS